MGTPEAADAAVRRLQQSDFDDAHAQALAVLEIHPGNARARAVAGLTLYKKIMQSFALDVQTIRMAMAMEALNHRYLRWSLEQTELGLAQVEEHLAVAAADQAFSLNLCLACWQNDWNHDGRINYRDEALFQVELDADGRHIPEDDPRRKPTFRFDVGDLAWARAMVAFQQTALNVLLAYRWSDLDQILAEARQGRLEELTLTIRMDDKARVHKARDLLLAGLKQADIARRAYLAETDDEREWVPNPKQKNHPLPLPVDQKLYDTWAGVLEDLRLLVCGKTGISVAEVAQLGDHQWQDPPQGYVNIGKLIEEPGDLVISFKNVKALGDDRTRASVERVLADVFGDKYVPQMAGTQLISRLLRMKDEIHRGEESLERKLRYLLWLN
jgi:hypothetical protein